MNIKRILLFVNLGLVVVGVIFLICGLALPWLSLSWSDRGSTYNVDITLTKAKIEASGASMTLELNDLCKNNATILYVSTGKAACKTQKASTAVIVLTVFGMLSLVVAGAIAAINLFTQIAEKAPEVFKFTYFGTSIAGFVMFNISFNVYNTSDDEARNLAYDLEESFKFGSGWALYLIAMIFSFATLILGFITTPFADETAQQ